MTRRSLTWFLVVCLVLLVFLVVAAVSRHPPEPVYRGVGLSRWLRGDVANPDTVASALGSFGPESLPWLISAVPGLEFRQRLEAWLLRFGQKSPVANRLVVKFVDQSRHCEYFNACALLGTLAPGSAYETKALKAFTPRRPSDDTPLIILKVSALGRCTNSPDKAIPILVAELTNSAASDFAFDSIVNFGSVATPRLYPFALRETGMIRPAEAALERADPLAYKRLMDEKERRRKP